MTRKERLECAVAHWRYVAETGRLPNGRFVPHFVLCRAWALFVRTQNHLKEMK